MNHLKALGAGGAKAYIRKFTDKDERVCLIA